MKESERSLFRRKIEYMDDDVILKNETYVEQVAVFQKDKEYMETQAENQKMINAIVYVAALAVTFIIWKIFDLSIIITLIIGVVLLIICAVVMGQLTKKGDKPSQSIYNVGEKIRWMYAFYEDFFIAENEEGKEKIEYSQIMSVKDTGAGYQIKGNKNYTLKRSGFNGEDEWKFVDLMKKKGVGVLLKYPQI